MTTKREYLHRLVWEVRRWVEWHGGEGAGAGGGLQMGSIPAREETREAFEQRAEAIRRAKRKKLQETLDRGDDGESDRQVRAPSEPADRGTDDSGGADPGAGETGDEPALWSESQLGSGRPESTSDDDSKKPDEAPTEASQERPATNAEKLQWLRDYMGDCQRCPLWENRKNLVFGEGNPEADVVFVGEAPGAREDETGRPFVGPAGQLLNKMINAMGLARQDTYICNVLKSRPPGNRDPQPDEVAECFPFLQKQLEIIRPGAIVTLGRPATQTLLESDDPLGALRGRWHTWNGLSVMPTYHPAYLLRSPDQKRKTWNDLQQVIDKLGLAGPDA